jgi:hypothetical protein
MDCNVLVISRCSRHLDRGPHGPPAHLVALRIVQRRGRATGTTYALTERGLELWPAVYALAQWEKQQFASEGTRRVISHANCGTDLTHTGWCVTCDCAPPPADLVIRSGPGTDPTVPADRISVALRKRPHRLLAALFPEHAPTLDGIRRHGDPEGAV